MGSDFDAHRAPLQSEHVNCSGALRPPRGGTIPALIERRHNVKAPRQNYVQVAAKLASNREKLAQLRAGFRERMLASPLMNGKDFAQNMGNLIE